MTDTFMILGASSWIGHYVLRHLTVQHPKINILALSRSSGTYAGVTSIVAANKDLHLLGNLIDKERPKYVLNLARGEDEDGFRLHTTLIDRLNAIGSHYGYASSANAVDANYLNAHTEDELPNSQSDYGTFKGKCESALSRLSQDYSVYRFSAVHGWAPNRVARTEEFLRKLKNGEEVSIMRGIIQNRCFVGDLATMMVEIMLKRGQGLFNLGTSDASEEIDFYKEMAQLFGYSEAQVVEGELNCFKAIMVPSRVFEVLGSQYKRTEAQTLAAVRAQPELKTFVT